MTKKSWKIFCITMKRVTKMDIVLKVWSISTLILKKSKSISSKIKHMHHY